MAGYETLSSLVAAKLREMLPQIQLIALSGYGQASDQAKSQEAGFQHHLVKPVDVRRLLQAIGETSGT